MLLFTFLKSLARRPARSAGYGDDDYPHEHIERLGRAHEMSPLARHREILFDTLRVGPYGLNEFVDRCVAQSMIATHPLKALHRPLASFFLIQYFLHAFEIEGEQAECGVFRGTSALLLCRAAQTRISGYQGAGFHLIDSFSGLSEPSAEDRFAVPRASDAAPSSRSLPGGMFAAPIELVRSTMTDFPLASYHAGWIPAILDELPVTRWSFVHLDVDLYEPTLRSLEYFYPKLSPGGVIICDDYGAPLFPGARRAWNSFCDDNDTPYIVLDTGQSVILKG